MGDSLNVDTTALRQHADAIGDAASLANQAADAGTQVTPGGWDNAYGMYCQMFPVAVRPVAQLGIEVMRKLAKQLSAAQSAMKATADQYDQQEHETTSRLKGLLGEAGALRAAPSVGGGEHVAIPVGGRTGSPIRMPTLPRVPAEPAAPIPVGTDPLPPMPSIPTLPREPAMPSVPALPDDGPIRGTLDV